MQLRPAPVRHDVARSCAAAGTLAVGVIRRSLHQPGRWAPREWDGPASDVDADPTDRAPHLDLHWAATCLFRDAHRVMLGLQGSGLVVAVPGSPAATRHERRLLRAVAAAQADDGQLVDNFLFKLAPHRQARPVLAHAVTVLGTSLAARGYRLAALCGPVTGASGVDG